MKILYFSFPSQRFDFERVCASVVKQNVKDFSFFFSSPSLPPSSTFSFSSSWYCPIEWNVVLREPWKFNSLAMSKDHRLYGSLNTLFQRKRAPMLCAQIRWCSHIKSTKMSSKHKRNPHHRNHAVVWFCHLLVWLGFFLCVQCVVSRIATYHQHRINKNVTQKEITEGKNWISATVNYATSVAQHLRITYSK